jgi:RimJ/RimL family protein N-acetyltransferase
MSRSLGPRLTTSRLLLRRWEPSDFAPFADLNNDPEVMRHIREPMTPVESDAFVDRIEEHFKADGYGLWALEVRATGAFVGFTGLAPQTFEAPFNPSVEVGWRLARGAWGHGYATEAGSAALDFAFEVLELDEVVSITTAGNLRSQAVMRRLGMTRDPADDFEQPHLPVGHRLRPGVLHRLSRQRWAADRRTG